MSLFTDLRMGWRYTQSLARFLWQVRPPEDAAGYLRDQVARREERLIETLRLGVFARPRSPYLALMRAARLDAPTVYDLIQRDGVDAAITTMREAGVYVTLDEFKGRTPIVRPGIELPVTASDFDNPLARPQLEARTGGSRTPGTRLLIDIDEFIEDLAYNQLWFEATESRGWLEAAWRPAPPATGGLKQLLCSAKLGQRVARNYSQTRIGPRPPGGWRGLAISADTWLLSHLRGSPIPWPRHVPLSDPGPIVRYLSKETQRGARVTFEAMVSSAVILCHAASEMGLDISGHLFRTTAEPLTAAKAAVIYGAGCDVISLYAMTDAGRLGFGCTTPNALDDVHLCLHKIAIMQVAKQLPGWPQPVGALYLTTLLPTAPKLLLNVETGDYAVRQVRACGCPLGAAGLTTHLHTIRNYEKLTSAGMHFMGADLIELLEVALPQRYGGHPTDYQFVEAEQAAQTILKLVINPSVGVLDAAEVKVFVLRELERRTAGGRLMTDIWRDSDTLRIERGQPYLTGSAKIQPLHVMPNRMRASQ